MILSRIFQCSIMDLLIVVCCAAGLSLVFVLIIQRGNYDINTNNSMLWTSTIVISMLAAGVGIILANATKLVSRSRNEFFAKYNICWMSVAVLCGVVYLELYKRKGIGYNEHSAMVSVRIIDDAQREYYRLHGLYASTLRELYSSQNVLVASDLALADYNCPKPIPYNGYLFKILSAQSANAFSGKISYIVDGKLSAGYALVAWPSEYGITGTNSYIWSSDRQLFWRDCNSETEKMGPEIREFDPAPGWRIYGGG